MQHISKELWDTAKSPDWSKLANDRAPDYGSWLSFGVVKSSGCNDLKGVMPRTVTIRQVETIENKPVGTTEARYVQVTPELVRLANILSDAYKRGRDVSTRMKLDEKYSDEIVGGYLGKLVRIIVESKPDLGNEYEA